MKKTSNDISVISESLQGSWGVNTFGTGTASPESIDRSIHHFRNLPLPHLLNHLNNRELLGMMLQGLGIFSKIINIRRMS